MDNKIALFGTREFQFKRVFTPQVLKDLQKYGTLSTKINKKNIEENKEFLKDCQIGFATWGMPKFTTEEIKEYMPNLKALFYCAGTVQYFAKPFLESGIKVFSAFAANSVPVSEYTFAQIMLANKGYYRSAKWYKLNPLGSILYSDKAGGNFRNKVGLIGLGAIGKSVAQKLMNVDVDVLAYDPFVSQEVADKYNVQLADIDTIFSECNVISNHLANKKELQNIYTGKLFCKMKKNTTFINTGRGAQVCEYQLALQLLLHPSKTAVLDVVKHEYFPYINPLFWCPNAIMTPHIAGSNGNEPQRMAYYMMEEMERYNSNQPLKYEVTLDALKTMA